ncbi:tRNA dihydrouridine synthase DusB [Tindallia californiensis]|uniref:tRNA-dihydrouridine synthase n=1 Tax=Tindallia californiensis TaxID=159292 RepID=A0A1H3L019_9FIRM|nr:tRNA dihydrouridine synthase DusB [Tindallia californiensis]SDY57690.1 tRNA-U20-dihydrouridine synthase [Tindallia californiensis]
MKPFKIGKVEIKTPLILAPMAGVTDLAFRVICKKFGCGMTVTEMISAKGLYYHDRKTSELMRIDETETPVGLQIFGSDPEIMGWAADYLDKQPHDILDINMGCPAPKIVKNGDGSALMKEPELAARVIRAVVEKTSKPVSVKIRAGWDLDSLNAVDLAKIAEDNGAKAITIHGRTREQFYSGKADWSVIKAVKEAVTIPVIGNGDIFEASDAREMFLRTGCDAVMIGRGAQGNPWLFHAIRSMIEEGAWIDLPQDGIKKAVKTTFEEHLKLAVQEKGERIAIKEMRKHAAWYTKGFLGSAKLRKKINMAESAEEMIELMNDCS